MPRPRQSGQAILLFILLIGVGCGLLGLAVDGSRVFDEKRRVQSLADAAAIGAAYELRFGGDEAALREAALADVRINGFRDDTDQISVSRVEVDAGAEAVEVSVSRKVRMTLLALFGSRDLLVRGVATATLARGATPCVLALAEDGADALVVEGAGAIQIDCEVEVRSAAPEALSLPDAGCLSADAVRANAIEDACVAPLPSPAPTSSHNAVDTPAPTCEGLGEGAITESADGVVDYWPGCYRDRIIIADGAARFGPGRYVLLDGMEIADGEVTGRDVSFALAAGPLAILEESWVDLDAGARERLFDTAASEGEALLTPEAGSVISGGLHFPARELVWRPNARETGSWNTVTAERIRLLVEDDNRRIAGPPALSRLAEARPVLIQ